MTLSFNLHSYTLSVLIKNFIKKQNDMIKLFTAWFCSTNEILQRMHFFSIKILEFPVKQYHFWFSMSDNSLGLPTVIFYLKWSHRIRVYKPIKSDVILLVTPQNFTGFQSNSFEMFWKYWLLCENPLK